ncbi:hypothetical protein BA6E_11048 [Bacteroidales bacterium 6E]|nr:hypothetical protein BA6E_11048 [Bacteroidales bacterium 6E]
MTSYLGRVRVKVIYEGPFEGKGHWAKKGLQQTPRKITTSKKNKKLLGKYNTFFSFLVLQWG